MENLVGEIKPAEPMLRANSSSVLRSDLAASGDEENGPGARGAERRAIPALPCLSVTIASEEEKERPPLPGPRKKQAEALCQNIEWMARTFGLGRVGFLTLTLGDVDVGGRFRNLRDRKEAQRRFHSLLTNEITRRYVCGVTITERHRNGGIHFHLVVVCRDDIRGQIDFAACFPPKGLDGKPVRRPDYCTANDAIHREWRYWQRTAKRYGFGRHQLQPMRENGEALGRYLGAYLRKDWEHRQPEDKGARCIRYFGHWSIEPLQEAERRKSPPCNSRISWNNDSGWLWRHKLAAFAKERGIKDLDQLKKVFGPRWAYHLQRVILLANLGPEVVYPSKSCADRALALRIEGANIELLAQRAMEKLEVTRCVLLKP